MSQSPKVSKFTFSQEVPIEVSLAGFNFLAKLTIAASKVISQIIESETNRRKFRKDESQAELFREKTKKLS